MPQPPAWFIEAIDTPAESRFVENHAARIHYRRYSPPSSESPLLVFVHGNGAHCHWWDFIAPAFTGNYRVVTLDLSGAGDSDHRDTYSAEIFANDIMCVVRAEANNTPVYIVGHSFGGSMTRITGHLYGQSLAGIVIADSVITPRRRVVRTMPKTNERVRHYASLEEGKRRFRLRPPQPCANDFIIDHIATHSLKKNALGYCFKLDQSVFQRMAEPHITLPDAASMIRQMPCPVALMYGEHSRFFPAEAVTLARDLFPAEQIVCVNDAYHHLFLDQPLTFIDGLTTLLARQQQPG